MSISFAHAIQSKQVQRATCKNDTTAQIQTKIVAFDRISMGIFIKFWREMEIKHDNND